MTIAILPWWAWAGVAFLAFMVSAAILDTATDRPSRALGWVLRVASIVVALAAIVRFVKWVWSA